MRELGAEMPNLPAALLLRVLHGIKNRAGRAAVALGQNIPTGFEQKIAHFVGYGYGFHVTGYWSRILLRIYPFHPVYEPDRLRLLR